MTRRLALLLCALLSALALAGAAGADELALKPTNAAQAVNTTDGTTLFDFAFHVDRVQGDVVDNFNAALAYASCESCRSVAIAVEIVLVAGHPTTVTPKNVAVSLNENCTACESFAGAYQFVIGKGDPLKLTHDGKTQLKEIRRELRALDDPALSLDEIRARATALIDELEIVLRDELVPKHAEDADDGADDEHSEHRHDAPARVPDAPRADEDEEQESLLAA